MEVKNLSAKGHYVQDVGTTDYIHNGVLFTDAPVKPIMLENKSD